MPPHLVILAIVSPRPLVVPIIVSPRCCRPHRRHRPFWSCSSARSFIFVVLIIVPPAALIIVSLFSRRPRNRVPSPLSLLRSSPTRLPRRPRDRTLHSSTPRDRSPRSRRPQNHAPSSSPCRCGHAPLRFQFSSAGRPRLSPPSSSCPLRGRGPELSAGHAPLNSRRPRDSACTPSPPSRACPRARATVAIVAPRGRRSCNQAPTLYPPPRPRPVRFAVAAKET